MELGLGFRLGKSIPWFYKHTVCHSDGGGISAAIFYKAIPIFGELLTGIPRSSEWHTELKYFKSTTVTTKFCHSDEGGISVVIFYKAIPLFGELLTEIPPSSE